MKNKKRISNQNATGALRSILTVAAGACCLFSATFVCADEVAQAQKESQIVSDELFGMSISDLMKVKVSVASLFEESELDVASSVSLIQAKDWEKTGARRISDVLESVPSVSSYPTWGGAEAIAIRGYATELSVRGLANTLDGIPLNTYVYATSMYDKPLINLAHLDRVEMIRGPGSTLYGTDAFHGVISRKLKSSDANEVVLSGRTSTSDYYNSSVFVSQNKGNINFNFGAAVANQGAQDLGYHYTSPDDGLVYSSDRDYEYRDLSAYTTLQMGDFDSTAMKFTVYVDDFESSEFPGIGTQFFSRIPLSFDVDSTSLTEDREHSGQTSNFWLSALDVSHVIAEKYTLETKLYHWQSKQRWEFDNTRYPTSLTTRTNVTLPCRNATNSTPNPIYCPHDLIQGSDEHRSGAHVYIKAIEEQLNTQWAFGFGRDRLKVDASEFQRVERDGNILLDQSNPYLGAKRTIDFALFQARTNFYDEQLQLVYGIRADDYSDVERHYSPRVGAIFNVSQGYTTKLLYGHAFRAPTALEKMGSVQGVDPNSDIKPEEIDTVEWVNVFYGRDYSLEGTLFQSKWDEGIVLAPSSGVRNQYVNTGENESWGAELSARKQFSQLTLQSAASYVESENKDNSTDYLAFPTWLLTVQGNYLFQDANVELILKQRVMLDYAEGDYLGSSKPQSSDDYYRTDLSVVKNLDGLAFNGEQQLFFHLRNVFDRDNTVASLYNSEGGLAESGIGADVGVKFTW